MTRLSISAAALALIVAATIAGIAAAAATAPERAAIEQVRAVDRALNAHDARGVQVLLADDATVQDIHAGQSREQVYGWIDELIRQDVQIVLVGDPTVAYDTEARGPTTMITWRATLDLEMYRARGLSVVPATLRAGVAMGAITYLGIHPDADWNPAAHLLSIG